MAERWSINDLTKKSGFVSPTVVTTGSSRWSFRIPGQTEGAGFSNRQRTSLNYDSEASELEAERRKEASLIRKPEEKKETLFEAVNQSWDVAADYARTGKLNAGKVKTAAEQKVDLGGATKSLVSGAAKSTGASLLNAGSTILYALDSGTVSGKSAEELVRAPKPKTPEVMQKTADRLAESADKDISIARETLGDLVTDVGVGLVQLGGDVAAGMLVPGGGLVSMMTRSFGGKSQEVRRKGGSLEAQVAAGTTAAVTEYLFEKISSVGKFQTKYFGSGAVDDILNGVIAAVEDLGKTKSGRAWLNHLATGGFSFLSEGVEEGLSGMLEPVADRIIGKLDGYEDQKLDWKQIGREAGHAFLVGGIIGALGGTVGGTNTKNTPAVKPENTTQRRGVGRVTGTQEQFAQAYRAKRNPSATDAEMVEQYERFKGYAKGFDTVETPSGVMTREQLKESFGGQHTAEEIDWLVDGLLDEQEAKNTQSKYFGERAGMVKDENWKKAHLRSRDSRVLDAVGKVTGTEIRYVPTIDNGTANAKYENGVIYLALDAEEPVMTSLVHETIHRIRETDAESYNALSGFVQTNMSKYGKERSLALREELYETTDLDTLTEEVVADAFGRMLNDSTVLEQFVQDNRTAAEKVLDVVRDIINAVQRALNDQNLKLSKNQIAEFQDLQNQMTGMEQLFSDALKRVANGNQVNYNESIRYSEKEGGEYDSTRTERIDARNFRQSDTRRENEDGTEAQGDGRSRSVSSDGRFREVSASFGQEPFRTWAKAGIVDPRPETVAQTEQQTAIDFGVPSFVVSDSVWAKNRSSKDGKKPAPAFSVNGQIYLQETLPEEYRDGVTIHEVVHVMEQLRYKPYLELIAKTPEALNMHHIDTWTLLEGCAKHCGVDLFEMNDGDNVRLYDELNATIMGSLAINDPALQCMKGVFYDFDGHVAELTDIVERFKQRNRSKESKKGRAQLDEYINKNDAIQNGISKENTPKDREATMLVHGSEKVSARTLGINGGTEKRTVYLVEVGETEDTWMAKQLAQNQGLDLILFVGGDLELRKGEEIFRTPIFADSEKLYVRADHPIYTADQLARKIFGKNFGEVRVDSDKVYKHIRKYFIEKEGDALGGDDTELYQKLSMEVDREQDRIHENDFLRKIQAIRKMIKIQ